MKSRLASLCVVVGLVLAACSTATSGDSTSATGQTVGPADATTAGSTPAASETTTPDGGGPATTEATAPTTTLSDREVAPDFTLELGEGGTYTLSEGEKPVYLVFWAEW